jgi:hypothetical protein
MVVGLSIVGPILTTPFLMGPFTVGSFMMGLLRRRFLVLVGRLLRASFILDRRVRASTDDTFIILVIRIYLPMETSLRLSLFYLSSHSRSLRLLRAFATVNWVLRSSFYFFKASNDSIILLMRSTMPKLLDILAILLKGSGSCWDCVFTISDYR